VSDPTELAGVGVGGLTIGGLLVGFLKALGSRQVTQLDKTIEALTAAVRDLDKEIRDLREMMIATAKDIGALQEANKQITARIDGQASHYRERLDSLQLQLNERARRPKK